MYEVRSPASETKDLPRWLAELREAIGGIGQGDPALLLLAAHADPDGVGLDVTVADGVVHLGGELESRTEVHLLEELSRRISGVVRVDSDMTYQVDDRKLNSAG